MTNLTVQQKINRVKSFLQNNKESASSGGFEGTYKTPILGLTGTTKGTVDLPAGIPSGNGDVLDTLLAIKENQEIERKRWERRNSVEGDEPIETWSEVTIAPGYLVRFTYTVPEGHIFYMAHLNITYQEDTIYDLKIDGAYNPQITDPLQDWGDHFSLWDPPKMSYNTIEVSALNLSGEDLTYGCFIRGFNRWFRSIKREITYESLKKSPDVKIAL